MIFLRVIDRDNLKVVFSWFVELLSVIFTWKMLPSLHENDFSSSLYPRPLLVIGSRQFTKIYQPSPLIWFCEVVCQPFVPPYHDMITSPHMLSPPSLYDTTGWSLRSLDLQAWVKVVPVETQGDTGPALAMSVDMQDLQT